VATGSPQGRAEGREYRAATAAERGSDVRLLPTEADGLQHTGWLLDHPAQLLGAGLGAVGGSSPDGVRRTPAAPTPEPAIAQRVTRDNGPTASRAECATRGATRRSEA
jgi:hypothetical protein